VTHDQAQLLATLARAIRPHGARRWDEAGIVAAIGRVKHLALADVAQAVIRAADDRSLETPGAIGNPSAPCWKERVADRPQPITPYDPAKFCDICGKSSHAATSDHEFITAAEHARRLSHDTHKPSLRDLASGATEGEGA
jgi:hypothetical protein